MYHIAIMKIGIRFNCNRKAESLSWSENKLTSYQFPFQDFDVNRTSNIHCLLKRQWVHLKVLRVDVSAMSRELTLKSGLQGDVITHKIDLDTTVGQLKAMLLENKTKDPIERKILRVELLQDCSIMKMDDAQKLGITGLLEAEALPTIIYKRNEVEAATQADVQTQGLFHLNIPPDLKTISGFAFQDCTNLVSVSLTQSVTHIGSYAFSCCFSLARITLGDSMTHIQDNAFRNCASLKSITMGGSVKHIGDNAFRNCTSLTSITFGESVTHIGKNAFEGCTMLHLFGKD